MKTIREWWINKSAEGEFVYNRHNYTSGMIHVIEVGPTIELINKLEEALSVASILLEYKPGTGLNNAFQPGTRAEKLQDDAMRVLGAHQIAYSQIQEFKKIVKELRTQA